GVQRLQHRRDALAEIQVGVADDSGGGPAGAIQAAGAGGGQPLDKLNLPHGAQLHRAIRAVHCPGFNKHGGAHLMAALDVSDQLVEEIPLVGDTIGTKIPEMMMGITDGQLWLQGRFLGESQPVIASVWHKGTSVAHYYGARSVHGRRAPVVVRHDGVSAFPGVARQHSKKPCATQWLLARLVKKLKRTIFKELTSPPSLALYLASNLVMSHTHHH